MSILIGNDTIAICQGFTGSQATLHCKQAIEYGTNLVGGVTPGKEGERHLDRPVFGDVKSAVEKTKANTSIIFVPAKFCKDSINEALDAGIKLIIVITEGIPTLDMLSLKIKADEQSVSILINSLSVTLFYWGIAVSKEIYLINKKKGLSFIRNLLRNPFIKSSSIFMGILVDQYIFGKDVFLKDKAKIFFYILSSFFFSLLKKNMYQSFYYIIRNIKKLRNKKRLNNKAENLLKK